MSDWTWEKIKLSEPSLEQAADFARIHRLTVNDVLDSFRRVVGEVTETFICDLYSVNIREITLPPPWPPMKHLSILRRDKAPVGKERFRHFQRIKNELVGPECEAVELYPAESRLVDTANQYHLWCFPEPEMRFPWGYENRLVLSPSNGGSVHQEPF